MNGTIEGNVAPGVDDFGDETDEGYGTAQRRRRVEHGVIAALVVVVLAAIALIGFQSGADEDQDRAADRTSQARATTTEAPATETTVAPTTAPTTAGENPAPAAPAAPAEPAHDEHASAVLEDGRHPAYLTSLDPTGRTLQFDLVQWLTGDAASEYVEAHPDEYPGLYDEIEETGGYPYDVLVANENPRLRTLPIADDPQIVVIRTPDSSLSPHTIGFDDLPGYLAEQAPTDVSRLSYNVFWLTVHDGEIVAIEEQFQP